VPAGEGKALAAAAVAGADSVKAQEDLVLAAFKSWDADGNGSISMQELLMLCKSLGMKEDKAKLLMKEADTNKDGNLSYEELVAWLFQAPYLTKMFQSLESIIFKAEESWLGARERKKSATTPAEKEQHTMEMVFVEEELVKKIRKDLEPFVKDSFKWHDKHGNGVLTKDESITFFTNYASLLTRLVETAVKKGRELNKDFKPKGITDAELQQHVEAYHANIDKHHADAFAVVDVNSTGSLSESDVLAACVPGTSQNHKFVKALLKLDAVKVQMNLWQKCVFPS